MIRTYRPYSVDDGHNNNAVFDAEATGVLIAAGGWAHTRFRGIDIPQGSTINSATLRIPWGGKNGVAASIYSRLQWATHAHNPNTLASYTYPYNNGYQQRTSYRTYSRTEGDTSDAGRWITFNLLTEFSTFKTYMQGTSWNMHDSMTFSLYVNSITGIPDIFFTGGRDSWQLTIDFTPPVNPVRTEILNHAINPHAQYSQEYYNPWQSNPALGNYPGQTTISRATMPDNSSLGVTTGWQVTWQSGQPSWTNHWAFNKLEFGEWYTFSAWCYVPTGAPNIFIDFLFQTVSPTVTVKNQWVKLSHKFLNTTNNNTIFLGIAAEQPTTMSGPHLYMTKVMFTKGEEQPDYFGGAVNQSGVGTAQYTSTGEETRLYVGTLVRPSLSTPATTSTDNPASLSWTNGGSNHRVYIKRSS